MSRGLIIRVQLARADFRLDVSLELPQRGVTVLFGPSGSGKTTLLRCVAGLEQAQGTVRIGGECWQNSGSGKFTPTHRRDLGYVFQEASLFEHLSIRQNLEFGLRRVASNSGGEALRDAVSLLGIAHLLDRQASSLSGGERQRVAIARALATQPRLLLLDEPLAALDHARRMEILPWLQRLHDAVGMPVLYVTHSLAELVRLADHVVLMDRGMAAASGPASEVLRRAEFAQLSGEDVSSLLEAVVVEIDSLWGLACAQTAAGPLWLKNPAYAAGETLRLKIAAREVSLALSPPQQSSMQNSLPGQVITIEPLDSSEALVHIACGEATLAARITRRAVSSLSFSPNMPVWCHVKSVALVD